MRAEEKKIESYQPLKFVWGEGLCHTVEKYQRGFSVPTIIPMEVQNEEAFQSIAVLPDGRYRTSVNPFGPDRGKGRGMEAIEAD